MRKHRDFCFRKTQIADLRGQHTEHYFRKTDLKFQCKKCGSRMSLRSGTVMENTNLPFQYWMICINKEVKKSVEKSASVLTDGYTGYAKLKEKIAHHDIVVEPSRLQLSVG